MDDFTPLTARQIQSICANIENRMYAVACQRGMKHGASDGICIMSDPLALKYQRLDRLRIASASNSCARSIAKGEGINEKTKHAL